MTDSGCAVVIDHSGTTITVTLSGEFDLAEVDTVRAALEPLVATQVDVDLAAVTFLDSAGLRCLLQLRARAAEHGGRLTVRAVSPVVQALLQITGTTDQLVGDGCVG